MDTGSHDLIYTSVHYQICGVIYIYKGKVFFCAVKCVHILRSLYIGEKCWRKFNKVHNNGGHLTNQLIPYSIIKCLHSPFWSVLFMYMYPVNFPLKTIPGIPACISVQLLLMYTIVHTQWTFPWGIPALFMYVYIPSELSLEDHEESQLVSVYNYYSCMHTQWTFPWRPWGIPACTCSRKRILHISSSSGSGQHGSDSCHKTGYAATNIRYIHTYMYMLHLASLLWWDIAELHTRKKYWEQAFISNNIKMASLCSPEECIAPVIWLRDSILGQDSNTLILVFILPSFSTEQL